MGLFGGFKAKFTKDSKPKDKPQNNVVILKYRSFSEFDTPYHSGPPTDNIKDNGVIHNNPRHKQRPIVNSTIFENSINDTANSIQKSLSLNNLVTDSKSTISVSTSRKEREFKSSTEPHKNTEPLKNTESPKNTKPFKNTKPSKKAETPSSSYQVVLPNIPSNQKIEEYKNDEEVKIKKSRKKAPNVPIITEDSQTTSGLNLQQNAINSKSSPANDSQYYTDESCQEQSTLIFMTQQNSLTESDAALSNDIYGTREYPGDAYNSNEHDFKVNVVQHDRYRTRSLSEDEISEVEEELKISVSAMGYSSQAASIFFGDDMMQPVITRPRRFIMMDDYEHEDDKNDDHHETDNEADC